MEYTFYADGNNLKKDDKVRVKIDGIVKDGIVTKANYFEYTRKLSNVPRALEIEREIPQEAKEEVKEKKVLSFDEMDDFVPEKKK